MLIFEPSSSSSFITAIPRFGRLVCFVDRHIAVQTTANQGDGETAAENLVGYSTAQPSLFKRNQLEPVRDLKLLIKDYTPIAKNALTILINISEDAEVLKSLAEDDAFLETLLRRVTVCQ